MDKTQHAVLAAFYWCCVQNALLEVANRQDSNSASVMALGQTVLVVLFSYLKLKLSSDHSGQTKSVFNTKIPYRTYLTLGALFAVSSLLNSAAYTHNITVPLHTIVKSGGLPITLVVGYLAFGYRFPIHKILSVAIIFIGTTLFSVYDKNRSTSSRCTTCSDGLFPFLHEWEVGVLQIVLGLVVSAFAGNIQQKALSEYKPEPLEPVFMTNLLSVPFTLLSLSTVMTSLNVWWYMPPISVSTWWIVVLIMNPSVPRKWFAVLIPILAYVSFTTKTLLVPGMLVLAAATLAQTMCILQVYAVATQTSALTTTTVNTIRKFISMVVSSLFFSHVFQRIQWFGVVLVSLGAVTYSFNRNRDQLKPSVR